MAIPKWFTSDFFEETLRKEKGAEDFTAEIKNVRRVEYCQTSYCNTLYKVTLRANGSGLVSLIVKTPPKLDFLMEYVIRERLFEEEAKMYREILPAMQRIAMHKKVRMLIEPLTAGSYDCSRRHTIILDDLAVLGMSSVDQRQGLDYGHCVVALRALARFHALSAVLLEKNPRCMDCFLEKNFFAERKKMLSLLFEDGCSMMASLVETWQGFEHFGPRLRAVGGDLVDIMIRSRDVSRLELVVLNHGDFWTGNIMFGYRRDGVTPCRARLVDFQSCKLGSPVLDLHCFLVTSPCDSMKDRDIYRLLEVYYEELCRVFLTVGYGYKIINRDKFFRDLKNTALYSLSIVFTFLNMLLAKPEDLENVTEERLSNVVNNTWHNPAYRRRTQKILQTLEDNGLL